ncbi:MAG: helix-turn-helix transcriptional regulator [Clostridia bacterium]|jgi:transcriptional regulator with XRE-family HTH domain|nr:helix-turn-helix transcriptional regulator [Clostridia bacterium]
MDFRNLLNDLLLVNGKSKMELSKEAQIPYTTICGWVNGRLPDYNAIIKLADYFNVSTEYILCRETAQQGETLTVLHHTQDEERLLQAYRNMSPGKKKALFNMLDIESGEEPSDNLDKTHY